MVVEPHFSLQQRQFHPHLSTGRAAARFLEQNAGPLELVVLPLQLGSGEPNVFGVRVGLRIREIENTSK